MTTTVRIADQTQVHLKALASQTGESMQEVLGKAVEAYRRQRIIEQTNAAYEALRHNPAGWLEEQRERADWDVTIADGLADG
jgi:predicted DNA-binding protein